MLKGNKFLYKCFMCGEEYQFGPHIYRGQYIPRYQIGVCNNCYKTNWDGWAPEYEDKLIKHLKSKKLPIPKRNQKGWIPRD